MTGTSFNPKQTPNLLTPKGLNFVSVFKPKMFSFRGQKNIACLGKAKLAPLITFPGQKLEIIEAVFSFGCVTSTVIS